MTTPAVNVNVLSTTNVTRTRKRYRADGSVSSTTSANLSFYTEQVISSRPASGTSPVRANGTRAPRAWQHRWARMTAVERDVVYRRPYGSGYEEWTGPYVLGLSIPVGKPTDVLVQQVGLRWCGSGNVHPFPQNVEALALTKFRNAVADGVMDLGVTLAELGKTVDGIQSACEDILSFAEKTGKAIKRSRRDVMQFLTTGRWPRSRKGRGWRYNRQKAEKLVVEKWLETQFALKPLLNDIESSSEALSRFLFEDGRPLRVSVKKGASESWVGTYDYSPNSSHSSVHGVGVRGTFECMAACHYSAVYDITPGDTRTLQQLGLTNPASVVWELIAFSWMVDYLVGVGDWISSLTRLEGARFVEGSVSRLGKVVNNDGLTLYGVHGWTLRSSGQAPVSGWAVGRFERTVLTSHPTPALFPPVRSKLNISRMANVLAALSQVASGGRRIGTI